MRDLDWSTLLRKVAEQGAAFAARAVSRHHMPTHEVSSQVGAHIYIVQSRAYPTQDAGDEIGQLVSARPDGVPELICKLLRLAPALFAEATPAHFPHLRWRWSSPQCSTRRWTSSSSSSAARATRTFLPADVARSKLVAMVEGTAAVRRTLPAQTCVTETDR
ncbi:MAG TPA: hypothetical protein VIY28_20485 [Pseudonocardiaceae bacterium]